MPRTGRTLRKDTPDLEGLWAHHHADLRDTHQVVSQWRQASDVDPSALESRTRGDWWGTLDRAGVTLLVTREYEHLVMALGVVAGRPRVSYLHLPHPSGLAVDPARGRVFIASTRNPNVVFDFAPCGGVAPGGRAVAAKANGLAGLLLPSGARYLPGCLYIHDLALVDGALHANAVGLNAVVRLDAPGGFEPVWWPRCIDSDRGPRMDRNYLQLNSIAAGPSLRTSYFTATASAPTHRRPGQLNFPVDRRGVVFSGATREVFGAGLTRPHSARLLGGEVWVDNSGYGELGRVVGGRFEPVIRLGGWTRGLYFAGGLAFVGTSRVIPRFRRYAPGLDADRCETGVHAVDLATGRVLGSLLWPAGNQIFAIEGVDRTLTPGFPFLRPGDGLRKRHAALFSRGIPAADPPRPRPAAKSTR
jgi:uncharacterized protein (TIGR03032 family)